VIRAGVFIGIQQTGGLDELKDAVAGAHRMHAWAVQQGMVPNQRALLMTDEGGRRITPDNIWDAVNTLISGAGIDQLIIYFAGHGVNINRCEHWLLSDAPTRPNAAVNVSGSVELARYCGVGHVAFISDACRVAPSSIQAQNVRGQDIFPNEGGGDRARPVDQFFACMLGKTAVEISDRTQAATHFRALYTDALHDALQGKVARVLEPSSDPTDRMRYVKPVKLQEYLEAEIPARIMKMQLTGKVNQSPDAILCAHSNWLARIEVGIGPPSSTAELTAGPLPAPLQPEEPVARSLAPPLRQKRTASARSLTDNLVSTVAGQSGRAIDHALSGARDSSTGAAARVLDTIERLADPFGPARFESECGVKIRGRRILEAFTSFATAIPVGPDGIALKIEGLERPTTNIVLRFEGGCGTIIPVLQGYVAALTFEGDELADVSYEPSANNWRARSYRDNAAEIRTLRAIAASAAQHGRFELNETRGPQIARRMQYAKGIDPTFAVYAAYAYHDLQLLARIQEMAWHLRGDIGVSFFDLALLSRELLGQSVSSESRVTPYTPLLAQGWSLLRAHRVRLPAPLADLERNMRHSLWSLYDNDGVDVLRKIMT